ncbi:MAG: glycosyltransferase family 2 protein [Chlorobiaceae bacterium]|nr:glycosyltransferase family 2 protein [Chlorobiaceae bacterium]
MYPMTWIVVLNWNGARDTLACLASLTGIESASCRVIVVDNGSADGSAELIRAAFNDIELLLLPVNLGYAAGNNAGYRRVVELGAEMVIFLNNDTIVDAGFHVPLIETLLKNASAGIAVPKIFYWDRPDTLWYAGGIVRLSTGLISHVGLRKKDAPEFSCPGRTGYATGCCMAMRSRDFQAVGGFDEAFGMYAEDVDLSLRVCSLGMSIEYVPLSRVWHKVSASLQGSQFLKLQKKSIGALRLFRKHRAWSGMVCYLLLLPLRLASSLGDAMREKHSGMYKTGRLQNGEQIQNSH